MTMLIGHCCIWLERDGTKVKALANASATVKYVTDLPAPKRSAYLRRAVDQNLTALAGSVKALSALPADRRMFRITSGLFPLYTHPVGESTYCDECYWREVCDRLAVIGTRARVVGARLSFHPGQFCVLNSTSEATRIVSIAEFEMHTATAVAMGYRGGNNLWGAGGAPDDFAINVHGGAGIGELERKLESWAWSWKRLSAASRRLITLENDENSWGAGDILALCQRLDVRMVPDVHHHWVRTGRWLQPCEPLVQAAHATWNGVVPKMHVSLPAPPYLHTNGRLRDQPIDLNIYRNFNYRLPERPEGVTLNLLRAHSDYIYHPGSVWYLNGWVRAGWAIQTEAKMKNLASDNLAAALHVLRGTHA